MGYDTVTLRHKANFVLALDKHVFWVPFNRLGESRFSNEDLGSIVKNCSARQVRNMKLNVYEAIQLFQIVLQFKECNDIIVREYEGVEWQLHKAGRYAYETNEGCCASSAAWLNYVIGKKYPKRGYLHYLRPDGSGHILNYIFYEGSYFIIDMAAQTFENAGFAPAETGMKRDYLSSELYTGICVMADELTDYVNYHRRFQLRKGYSFSYLLKEPYLSLPPCYSHKKDNMLTYMEIGKSSILRMENLSYTSQVAGENASFPIEYTGRYW